jgi:hypothetical protein
MDADTACLPSACSSPCLAGIFGLAFERDTVMSVALYTSGILRWILAGHNTYRLSASPAALFSVIDYTPMPKTMLISYLPPSVLVDCSSLVHNLIPSIFLFA